MFCTECGQQIADDAKFCAYCGTRRTIAPSSSEAPARPEPPVVTPPPARPVRSTAEIMPIRLQRPPVPQPRVTEAGPVQTAPEESAPPLFAQEPPVVQERPPARTPPPPPPAYNAAPPAAEAPAPQRYGSVPFADTQVVPEATG